MIWNTVCHVEFPASPSLFPSDLCYNAAQEERHGSRQVCLSRDPRAATAGDIRDTAGDRTRAAGHNDVAAWSATAGLADNVDLYLEQIGENGRSVREGAIGWQLTGAIPQREGVWGTVPLSGWDAGVVGRRAEVPFEQMPHTANPAAGLWRQGNGITIPWSRTRVAQIAQSTLSLEPTPLD